MNKELTVKQRIIDVLVSNQDIWMTAIEIAESGYGVAYIRDARAPLNSKIARNMNRAVLELKTEHQIEVIVTNLPRTHKQMKNAIRNNSSGKASELNPYKSYKIASIEDGDYLLQNLHQQQSRIDFYVNKHQLTISNFKKKGLL